MPPSFASLNFNLRHFWTTPFQYSLLVTASLTPKLIHLWSHLRSLPPVLTVLYLPTFMGLDVINAFLFWTLVHLNLPRGNVVVRIFRGLVCMIILGAASMQIAFYMETGGEIKWGAAGNFAHDPAGVKVLLSGSLQAAVASAVMVLLARIISSPLYTMMDKTVRKLVKAFTGKELKSMVVQEKEERNSPIYFALAEDEDEERANYSSQEEDLEMSAILDEKKPERWWNVWITRALCAAPFVIGIILWIVRPTTFPYAHMSGSLPYTLSEIWISVPNLCAVDHTGDYTRFPLTDLIKAEFWEEQQGKHLAWRPSENVSSIEKVETPSWLPKERVHGFERWYNDSNPDDEEYGGHGRHGRLRNLFRYDPVQDPLKISNLDKDILKPISEALKDRKIAIKHIVLLTLESTRGDIFPLQKGSHTYNNIIASHGYNIESAKKAEEELAQLTINAELLTGLDGGFTRAGNSSNAIKGSWRDLAKDRGGINVLGSLTGSTTSFKSVIGAHCGVAPLPVDFTVESRRKIYQPCVPQILNLFNHNKPKATDDMRSMPWKSVFAQSITDQFDHQDDLNRHMDWTSVIVKESIMEPAAKYFPPTEKESNYFGFPEPQIKPYLLDLFTDAKKNNERLFLSHMTSSTHHPWNTPEGTEIVDFMSKEAWGKENAFNRYLNTVKYADRWIGEVMDILQDVGVAEETLVVMVGDHGYAFLEDSPSHSTFENGHISNFRVPLVFHHPSLPRMQLAVNATSISIIPTILDLLTATESLNTQDVDIAENLIGQYEGQSLIRPYQTTKNGRQAWNIAVLNAGGAVLSVGSAAKPYRLIIPVCKTGSYRFTDTHRDPYELAPVEDFSINKLAKRVQKMYKQDASEAADVAQWVRDAGAVGEYWVKEQRRRWRYRGGGTAREMDPGEMSGMGQIKKTHWWDT